MNANKPDWQNIVLTYRWPWSKWEKLQTAYELLFVHVDNQQISEW